MNEFVTIDVMPMLAGALSALSCGLLGNYLVLRKESLMGDAISHAVLPGLVVAFMISQSRSALPMFVGATAAGLFTVFLTGAVRRYGRVESGAAMGVAFSVLFALGVLLLEVGALEHVDLDADCVLNGQLEILYWLPPEGGGTPGAYLSSVPRQVWALALSAALTIGFVLALFKELRIASFDPGLSTSLGIPAGLMTTLLMVLVACATVASFEAVGSILVIAMLICPAATARLLTDRLSRQIWLSAAIGVGASLAGYALGAWSPQIFGTPASLSASGMMTVALGAVFVLAIFLSPTHGVIVRTRRRARLGDRVALEDLLGVLYRAGEEGADEPVPAETVAGVMGSSGRTVRAARRAERMGLVERTGDDLALTRTGRRVAQELVRRHRLWEEYLVSDAGVRADHVHPIAEILEHVTDERGEPIEPEVETSIDPHGRVIPGRGE